MHLSLPPKSFFYALSSLAFTSALYNYALLYFIEFEASLNTLLYLIIKIIL